MDALRCLAAFLVVVIHCNSELGNLGDTAYCIANSFSRVGVACFFIIAGWFFPGTVAKGRLRNRISGIVAMALWSVVFYAVFNLAVDWLTNEDVAGFFSPLTDVRELLKFLFFNKTPFGYHLWFLFAAAYALVACRLLYRFGSPRGFTIMAALLLVAGLIAGSLGAGLLQRNWFLYGIPFVCAGILMRRYRKEVSAVGSRTLVLVLTVSLALTALESMYAVKMKEYYLFTLPASAALLELFRRSGARIEKGMASGVMVRMAYIGMRYSLYIYIFHVAVKSLCDIYVSKYLLRSDVGVISYPFLIFVLSLAVARLWLLIPVRLRPF